MNILCKTCYFVIRKCDCIGVCFWLQFKANYSRMWWQLNGIKWNEHFVQNLLFCYYKVWLQWCVFSCISRQIIQEWDGNLTEQSEMNIICKICYFVIRKCDCNDVYLVAIQSKSFKNVMAIEQNKVKWTFCAIFSILLLERVIALVCFWLQFKANHSRIWWQLNRIKWNEHFVQDLLLCY